MRQQNSDNNGAASAGNNRNVMRSCWAGKLIAEETRGQRRSARRCLAHWL